MKKYILPLVLLICFAAQAQRPDFSEFFEVDLDAPVPNLEKLAEDVAAQTEIYEPRYIVSWDMGPVFDKIWRSTITTFGTSEQYLKAAGEDDLTAAILSLDKAFYPYIGPFLHASPGVPEKILNMPGIKETKNKFPQRIAPQLADVEDLEFLSPFLYILLMPEMWPENQKSLERPQQRLAKKPQTNYNPSFYKNLIETIPEGGYGGANARGDWPISDNLRTLKITKTSPLTTADVKAFANTLGGVKAFATPENVVKLTQVEPLLDYYELQNGTALAINTLKDIVNPCQRLALKIKWAGLETEFSKAIAGDGFNLKDWAITCDKTVKAYRMINVSDAKMAAVRQYQKGLYNQEIEKMDFKTQSKLYATVASLLEMYQTNKNDVEEALKNEALLKEKFEPFGTIFVTSPLDY